MTTDGRRLGLIAADSGHIRIFDHEVPLAIDGVIDRVGAIVEQPKFFPAFTGQKNLKLLAKAIGAPRRRVAAVLDEVGLAGRDKYRNYSLGMKQRLAIAATLLKDPDLLIFDEAERSFDLEYKPFLEWGRRPYSVARPRSPRRWDRARWASGRPYIRLPGRVRPWP